MLVTLFAAILYLPGLGRPPLWEPDEGRYAEIAREMSISGDWVTPRNDFIRYLEKPPLVYWAEVAAIHAFGKSEFAVRLPAALFTVGEVAVTCAIADAMFGASAGVLAAIALALSPIVFAFARFATLDPALAFFLTAGLGCFFAAARAPTFADRRARYWMIAAAAMLALGTLSKGPVALVLGGAIALAFIILERRAREILRMPLLRCAAVFIVIALPWFILVQQRNPGFLHYFIVHEHLKRFTSSTEHGWGPWFFLPIIIGGAWPWIYFAPLGWIEIGRAPAADTDRVRAWRNLLVIWFAIIVVFFSIPRSKLGSYILPALPPLAILSGVALARIPEMVSARIGAWMRPFVAINLIAAIGGCAALFALHNRLPAGLPAYGYGIAIAIAVGAIIAWLIAFKPGRAMLLTLPLAIAMIVVGTFAEQARIVVAPETSYRQLAHEISPYLVPGCVLASYRHYVQALPFYTGVREMPVEYWGELAEFADPARAHQDFIGSADRLNEMWSGSRCFVLVANQKDLAKLARSLPASPAASMVACEGKKVALFNGPARGPIPRACAGSARRFAALGIPADGR